MGMYEYIVRVYHHSMPRNNLGVVTQRRLALYKTMQQINIEATIDSDEMNHPMKL